jgi:hypothetical protein
MEQSEATADLERGEAIAGKLARYPGPAWRRAYLEQLHRSGMDFLRAGKSRSAAYCLDKVAAALASLPEPAAGVADEPAAGVSGPHSGPGQAFNRVRAAWREDRVRRARAVLDRHGPRLSSLERKTYGESLEKWTQAKPRPAGPSAASLASAEARLDHALQEIRRRLYGRILKIQKTSLARRSGTSRALATLRESFGGVIGPYNDQHNLEGVLALLSSADAAWVEEFLDLYRGLNGLKALIPTATNK